VTERSRLVESEGTSERNRAGVGLAAVAGGGTVTATNREAATPAAHPGPGG